MRTTFIAIVGMPGSGKSIVADYLKEKYNFGFVRFGQITLDEVTKRWGKDGVNEEHERKVREEFRQRYGMEAFAILNLPKFDKVLSSNNLVGDGLYSWEEYKFLKDRYKDRLIVVAVVAGRELRHMRLAHRDIGIDDPKLRFRSFSNKEAISRDYSQIENLHQGGPIAEADYYIINETTLDNLYKQIEEMIDWAKKRGLQVKGENDGKEEKTKLG